MGASWHHFDASSMASIGASAAALMALSGVATWRFRAAHNAARHLFLFTHKRVPRGWRRRANHP